MITSSEEWTASLLRHTPWMFAVSIVAAAGSFFWVMAPPAYLIACAGVGALWFAFIALGAYIQSPHRRFMRFVELAVLIFGFMFVDNHLKAGGFFGPEAGQCVPQGFNMQAAHVQGLSVGLGLAFALVLVFRRWLVRMSAKASGSG